MVPAQPDEEGVQEVKASRAPIVLRRGHTVDRKGDENVPGDEETGHLLVEQGAIGDEANVWFHLPGRPCPHPLERQPDEWRRQQGFSTVEREPRPLEARRDKLPDRLVKHFS